MWNFLPSHLKFCDSYTQFKYSLYSVNLSKVLGYCSSGSTWYLIFVFLDYFTCICVYIVFILRVECQVERKFCCFLLPLCVYYNFSIYLWGIHQTNQQILFELTHEHSYFPVNTYIIFWNSQRVVYHVISWCLNVTSVLFRHCVFWELGSCWVVHIWKCHF